MNPNSIPTHAYPEFLAAAGAFFSSYGVMYFMTRALTVCHFSFRFRNTGEARLGALRSVEKRDVTTKNTSSFSGFIMKNHKHFMTGGHHQCTTT